jgi:hypothetical protein
MADRAASEVGRSKAVTEQTSAKSTTAWFRWQSYLRQIDIDDTKVAQTFLFHRHDDPRLDKQGKPAFILLRTLKGVTLQEYKAWMRNIWRVK